jgi:branched-chain amino acid transport system ATP-binding protein
MAQLEIERVTVRFGGLVALDGVELSVERGEFVSVIGPNGAGKTTLFNVIAGAIRPTSGVVRFEGRPVQGSRPAHMSNLGVRRSFQVARPFASMTVRENVLVAAAGKAVLESPRCLGLRGRDRAMADWVDGIIEEVGLAGSEGRKAAELTMGELRRLEIARALVGRPSLILLDEPAAGIGTDGLGALAGLIRAVHRKGLTVMLVEHYVGLALALSDRIIVLDEGAIIAQGSPEAVRNDERVIAAYLGKEAPRPLGAIGEGGGR